MAALTGHAATTGMGATPAAVMEAATAEFVVVTVPVAANVVAAVSVKVVAPVPADADACSGSKVIMDTTRSDTTSGTAIER